MNLNKKIKIYLKINLMNYLELLPSELITIISLYLNYNEIKINLENFDVDYRYLLSENYPAFYEIIYHLKNNDTVNKNYDYEEGYNLMNLVETLIYNKQFEIEEGKISNFRTNNIDDFMNIIYTFIIDILNIRDILASYNRIINQSELSKLFKYRKYFPNVDEINQNFVTACNDYIYYDEVTLQDLIDSYINYANNTHESKNILYRIFLNILENEQLIGDYKDKIINLIINKYTDLNEKVGKRNKDIQNELIIHQYIINYINKIEK